MGLTQVSKDGVKNDAIDASKLPANSVGASELADNAVDTNAIADDAVGADQLASNAVVTASIADNAITQAKINVPISNRNLIINGAMQVAQRNTQVTGISSGGYHICDRWKLGYGNAGIWTLSKSTDTPNNFGSSFKFDCTTASPSLSAGSNLQLIQFFEGQDLQNIEKGTSTAKQITVSFYVKTNKTGTYIVELMDHDNSNRHCSKSYTVSNTNWNRYELTFPADTTGTLDNDNAKSFEVGFWLVAGSTFQGSSLQTTWGTLNQGERAVGQVNLADSTSNEWYITGVQLEVGSVATDFEHRSFAQELLLCQRYYQQIVVSDGNAGIGILRASNSNNFQQLAGIPQIVKMRAAASGAVISSNSTITCRRLNGSSSDITASLSFAGGSSSYARISFRFTGDISGQFVNTEPYACWDEGQGGIVVSQDAEL